MKFTKKILLMFSLGFSLAGCKDITNTTLPDFPKNTQVKIADMSKAVALASFMKEDFDFIIQTEATKYIGGQVDATTNVTLNNPKLVDIPFDLSIGGVNLYKLSSWQYRSVDKTGIGLQKERLLQLGDKFSQGNLSIALNSKSIGSITDNLPVPACIELKKTNNTNIVKSNGYTLEWLGQPDNTVGVVIEISQPFAAKPIAPRYIVCEDNGSYTFSARELADYQVVNPKAKGNDESNNDLWVIIYRGNYKMVTSTEGYKLKVIAYSKAITHLKVY